MDWKVCPPLALFVGGLWACGISVQEGECQPGMVYCLGNVARTCRSDALSYHEEDCSEDGKVCVEGMGCRACGPGTLSCQDGNVVRCRPDGSGVDLVTTCDLEAGETCYKGRCLNACDAAAEERSYIGCEYWAVDLDNATISQSFCAAKQQFAVAVSNVGFVEARVQVFQNDAPVRWPLQESLVAEAVVPPEGLHVFLLPPREVDGSHDGLYDNGTHTFLSANAYHIRSTAPIVAYQFNPLENVQVFSNDASILVPETALDNEYLVMGWPQTIADTDDPQTDFNKNLRAFLTIVGTQPGTDVWITLSTDIVGGEGIPGARAGETIHVQLGPYEVANLETGSFNADFTGSYIRASKPVAVFSGSEASDVPFFPSLTVRRCCADHLEHQLLPESAAGTQYVAARMPPRTPAVLAAGGQVSIVDEPEYFRILALYDDTEVHTTLAPPDDQIFLDRGEFVTLETHCDFLVRASQPIVLGQFVAGQATTGIPADLPGGDPSFVILSPVEQWRSKYVFLTPDKYAFDFIVVVAPAGSRVTLDGLPLADLCERSGPDCGPSVEGPQYDIWRCQLSFPEIVEGLPPPDNVRPGNQNDGYHILEADRKVELLVYGFDKHVSYAYAGGMDVRRINVK